jgi:hypothetical protein
VKPGVGDERGQALIELVACIPVVALVALAIAQGMFALGAASDAQSAVERARVAAALGNDPGAAARRGLPARATVLVEGRTVRVSVPVSRVLAAVPLGTATAVAVLVR